MRIFARSIRGGISCSQSLWRSSQQTAETISSHSPGSSETKCLQSKAEIIHTEYQIITFPLLLRVHVNKADGIFLLTFFFCFRFMSVATAMTDSAHQSVSGQKQGAKIEAGWVQLFFFCLIRIYLWRGVLIFQSQFLADKVSFKLHVNCQIFLMYSHYISVS